MYEITLLHVQLFTNIRGPCSLYLLSFVYILVRQYFIVLVNFAKKVVNSHFDEQERKLFWRTPFSLAHTNLAFLFVASL